MVPILAALALAAPSPVSCDAQAYLPGPFRAEGRRIVLGAVALPQTYRPQVVFNGRQPWPYGTKMGLAIRGGVTVSVARAWRDRVRIGWGDARGSAVRFASCGGGWTLYAGGFELRVPSACVPLTFRVGRRSAIVRFGLGRRCG